MQCMTNGEEDKKNAVNSDRRDCENCHQFAYISSGRFSENASSKNLLSVRQYLQNHCSLVRRKTRNAFGIKVHLMEMMTDISLSNVAFYAFLRYALINNTSHASYFNALHFIRK